jgi:hypothetical protein
VCAGVDGGERRGDRGLGREHVCAQATLGQLCRYATAFDVACIVVGFLGAGAVGAAQLCMRVLFGYLIDVLGLQAAGDNMKDSFNEIARNVVLPGAGCFVCAWIGEACFKVSGLRQSAIWRKTWRRFCGRRSNRPPWMDCTLFEL